MRSWLFYPVTTGARVADGDLLLGLPSAGLHTNGYSLARRILFDQLGLRLNDRLPGSPDNLKVGEWLLAPHLSYLAPLAPLLAEAGEHALAHVSGGGLTDTLLRVLPEGLAAEIRLGSWELPQPYELLQEKGDIEVEEMFRVFNMGTGMVVFAAADAVVEFSRRLAAAGQRALPIGRVVEGPKGVVYDLGLTSFEE